MSTPNPVTISPIEKAAIPSAIAVLQAVQQFVTDLGTDPTKWALNLPGAELKLLGTIQLQVPTLLVSEGSAVQTEVNTKISGWITSLQAKANLPTS